MDLTLLRVLTHRGQHRIVAESDIFDCYMLWFVKLSLFFFILCVLKHTSIGIFGEIYTTEQTATVNLIICFACENWRDNKSLRCNV